MPPLPRRAAEVPDAQGHGHALRGVDYCKGRRVRHDVIHRPEGLPKGRDEARYLMTDLDDRAERTRDLYGRRMSTGESFRAGKGRRDGQSVWDAKIRHADRFDRFPLVMALAYILPVGLGLKARLDHDPSARPTNRCADECSAFIVDRAMLDRTNYPPMTSSGWSEQRRSRSRSSGDESASQRSMTSYPPPTGSLGA